MSRTLLTLLSLILAAIQADAQDPTQGDPTVGTDVFSIALNGGNPGPGPGPGIFIPPTGVPGNPGPGPGNSGGHVPTINLGKLIPKSSDPCGGHFTPVSDRQYFEMAAHPNQWLCAANGFSPGVHRVCADLKDLPRHCYDPNHPSRLVVQIVQNCLNGNSPCGQLLQRENCADVYRLHAEITAGVQFPAPGSPETALTQWTPLYLARRLPTLIGECQARGFRPASTDCADEAPSDMQREIAAIVQELNSMARATGPSALAASDSFFRGMADMLSASAQFLAQRPGEPARQVVEYLLNDRNANHEQLLRGAQQAVKDFQNNPAYFAGQNAMFFVEPAATCAVKAAGRTRLFLRIKKATAELRALNTAEEELVTGTRGTSFCSGSNQRVYNPGGAMQVNPFGEDKNCVPATIAGAKRSLPNRPYRPYSSEDIRPSWEDRTTPPREMAELLKKHFGAENIPDLPEYRMKYQSQGLPVKVDRAQIELELGAKGRGGIILTYDDVKATSHMFRAENIGGKIHYIDDQNGFNEISQMDAAHHFTNQTRIYLYRYK